MLAMSQPGAERAIELLIEEADAATTEGRYGSAVSTAGRAVQAAEELGSTNMQLRALRTEAEALRMTGDNAAALARYTRILGMSQDAGLTAGLDALATQAVARAYSDWVAAARFTGGFPGRELFAVLDAADRWFAATGHSDWRAGVLLQRASIHRDLGEFDLAVAPAEEALAAYRADAPGYTLASHRFELGDILRDAGRADEAEPLYQAILDDSTSSPRDRSVAWHGLARCALARDDDQAAVRHARAATDAAEPLGDDNLVIALGALTEAHRAAGDLDAAGQAAARQLKAARRLGTHLRLYYALRDAVDVALDRDDRDATRALLDELDEHAAALDTDTRTEIYSADVRRRRRRLGPDSDPTDGTVV